MASNRPKPPEDFDPVDAELTDAEIKQLRPASELFAKLGLEMPKPKGRPPQDKVKVPVTMRLDPDVLDFYKSSGPGWQTRMGEILAKAARKKSA